MASPRPPKPRPVVPFRAEDDRQAILLKSVESDLAGDGLERWEEQFCRWLALHGTTPRKRQLEVASALAGTTIVSQQLVQLRCRPAWKALWVKERNVETALKRAKADIANMIEAMPGQYKKMLGVAIKADDVRAATPLLVPLLDRVLPKKEEAETRAPSVHIHLSLAQATGLDAEPLAVEAEEVEYTVEES